MRIRKGTMQAHPGSWCTEMIIPRTAIALILTFALQSVPVKSSAQQVSESGDVTVAPEAAESAAEAQQKIPFSPALVGLPGFPDPLTKPEDHARAIELIEARLAVLREARQDGRTDEQGDGAGEAADALRSEEQDPRIAPLQALLLVVQHGAALAASQTLVSGGRRPCRPLLRARRQPRQQRRLAVLRPRPSRGHRGQSGGPGLQPRS